MTDNSEKNPFNQEEPLQTWFEQDKFYQNSNERDLGKLKVKLNYKPSIFMSLQDSYLKTINSITKHAILATLIMLVALGGVGASAAQILAPEEFKPSTLAQNLFKSNTQKDKDPYTSLSPDDENYVAKLDKCDLGIKYPRLFNGSQTSLFVYEKDDEYSYSIDADETSNTYFSVRCDSKKIPQITEYYNYDNRGDFVQKNIQITSINKEELASITGWLITQAEITDITKVEVDGELRDVYFSYKSIFYNATINGISFGRNIQLQFNSLVTNTFSDEIRAAKKEEGSIVKDCNDVLDVKYNPSIFKTQNVFDNETITFLTNFAQEKELKNYNENTAARVDIRCFLNTADLQGELLPLTPFKSSKDKIPFISENFRSQIVDNEVYQRIYELDGKGDPQGVKTDYVEIYFRDKQNIYSIYVDKLARAQKEFGLTIDRKKTPSVVVNSSNLPAKSTNLITGEEFEVISGGQMRYKSDSNGGFDLKRTKDEKVFAIMGSLLDSKGVNIQPGMKITLSGDYENIPTDNTFGGGSGNAQYIITNLTSVEINKTSKISRTLEPCGLEIAYPVFANNFSNQLSQINEENSMASLTGFPVNPPADLADATNLRMNTESDPLNRQEGISLQTDCYQGNLDIASNISWFNREPLGSKAFLTKPIQTEFCKQYNFSTSDCSKITKLTKISYDQNYTSCFYDTFTALNKTYVIHNCNFLGKGVDFSFK
jgi:hypothetical protein